MLSTVSALSLLFKLSLFKEVIISEFSMLSTVSALSFGWFVSSEIFSCIALYASSNELLSISVPNIFSDISSREIFSILISSDNALIYSTS